MTGANSVDDVTPERFGLVRAHSGLPDLERQSDVLTTLGRCGVVVEVHAGAAGEKRLEKVLATVPTGSTVCVVSLDVFGKPLADLVRLLRDLGELSISVALLDGEGEEVLFPPTEEVVTLLRHLSLYNGRGAGSATDGRPWYGRPIRTAAGFNRHQAQHAKKLYGEGMSLRAIGMIFETSPEEVWKVVS